MRAVTVRNIKIIDCITSRRTENPRGWHEEHGAYFIKDHSLETREATLRPGNDSEG